MQVSYHFALTKIQKLQNQTKKFFFFWVPASIARNRPVWPVFKLVINISISIQVYILVSVWYRSPCYLHKRDAFVST